MATICKVAECPDRKLAKGFCSKHYYRNKRGQSLTALSRLDLRPVVIEGDIAKLPLGRNGERGYAIVDAEDVELVRKYNWSIGGRGYAMAWIDGAMRKLHHIVFEPPQKPLVTDHINRNKLDNRKSNLRHVTESINNANKGPVLVEI